MPVRQKLGLLVLLRTLLVGRPAAGVRLGEDTGLSYASDSSGVNVYTSRFDFSTRGGTHDKKAVMEKLWKAIPVSASTEFVIKGYIGEIYDFLIKFEHLPVSCKPLYERRTEPVYVLVETGRLDSQFQDAITSPFLKFSPVGSTAAFGMLVEGLSIFEAVPDALEAIDTLASNFQTSPDDIIDNIGTSIDELIGQRASKSRNSFKANKYWAMGTKTRAFLSFQDPESVHANTAERSKATLQCYCPAEPSAHCYVRFSEEEDELGKGENVGLPVTARTLGLIIQKLA